MNALRDEPQPGHASQEYYSKSTDRYQLIYSSLESDTTQRTRTKGNTTPTNGSLEDLLEVQQSQNQMTPVHLYLTLN